MEASYDRRKIGRQASWPADLRGTSAGVGAYCVLDPRWSIPPTLYEEK